MSVRLRLVSLFACLCLAVSAVGCDSRSDSPASTPRAATGTPAPATARPSDSPSAPEATTAGPLVAFLGDSISAGLHVDEADAFPAVLARKLAARGTPIEAMNAGRSGDTTAGGLRRIDWILTRNPQIVVVELGGNDGLRGQPIEAIDQNLRKIIGRVQKAGATPLLLGMRIPTNYGAKYANDFAGLYEGIASELGIAYVPFFMQGVAGVPDLNHPDGIHPTVEGHRILADNLVEPLAKLLATNKGERPQSDPRRQSETGTAVESHR